MNKYQYNKPSKVSLPLIGTNYWWYDKLKGVARTNIRKNILGKNDQSPRLNWKTWFKNKPTQIRWYTDPDFTSGDNNYDYVRVPTDNIKNYEKLIRASFIPYIVNNGEKYWLLGSFFDFPEIKVDFGGKCHHSHNHNQSHNQTQSQMNQPQHQTQSQMNQPQHQTQPETPTECAARELREETRGVLNAPLLETLANKDLVTIYKGYTKDDSNKNTDNRTVFILINMTDHLSELDEIQKKIDSSKNITNEEFGPLGFYKESNVYRGFDSNEEPLYTSFALTDFINWIRDQPKQR